MEQQGRRPFDRAGDLWPRVTTATIAVVATGVSLWGMLTSREVDAAAADATGGALLVTAGACLLFRRRFPASVLLSVVAVTTVYLVLDYPGGAELPVLLVALYTCVAEGRRLVGLLVTLHVVGSSAGYRLLVDGDDPLLVLATISVVVLVAVLGELVRAHRRLRTEIAERVRLARVEQALEAESLRAADRLELARELHDVLAHTITAITVQAGAAADGLDPDDDAHAALRSMRATTQEAMRQLGSTIAVLRDHDGPVPHVIAPGLQELEGLADGAREAGLQVDLVVPDPVPPLTAAVSLTTYRVVQECLTNVLRHARAGHVDVKVAPQAAQLVVEVADDGVGSPAEPAEGFGLMGMRERTEALGGQLTAGPRPRGGFLVTARLPLERTSTGEGAG